MAFGAGHPHVFGDTVRPKPVVPDAMNHEHRVFDSVIDAIRLVSEEGRIELCCGATGVARALARRFALRYATASSRCAEELSFRTLL